MKLRKIMDSAQIKTTEKYVEELSPYCLALHLVKPGSKVLSAGCGAGREVYFLSNILNCEVTALDHNIEILNKSRFLNPSVDHILTDIAEFRSNKKYDYVVCLWNTINFLTKTQKNKFIKRCEENLKMGGKLIITSQNIFNKLRAFVFNIKLMRMYYYFPSEIKDWFKNTRFIVSNINIENTNLIIGEKK